MPRLPISATDRAAVAVAVAAVLAAAVVAALLRGGNAPASAPVSGSEAAEVDSFAASVARRDSAYAIKLRRNTRGGSREGGQRGYRQHKYYGQYNSPAADGSACRKRAAATAFPSKLRPGETVDLNCGDTAELRHVPGVGSVTARRIVRYGESLGGYVAAAQAAEVYGLDSSAVRWFTVGSPAPRKVNINRDGYTRLARHPYIGARRAAYIMRMRREWGRIRSLRALLNDTIFSPGDAERLAPYVEF